MSDRGQTSMSDFGGIISVIPKLHVTAFPWTLIHSESSPNRAQTTRKERYYKSGRGRDELEHLDLYYGRRGDGSRVQIPPGRL